MVEPERTNATTAYIGLGSNEGDRLQALEEALGLLKKHNGITLSAVSPVYETDPVDIAGKPFLNAAAQVKTSLAALQFLSVLNEIERVMGRTRTPGRKTSRFIDLDLLLFGNTVSTSRTLTLPHPRMKYRRFVLVPLSDLDPDLVIPGGTSSVSQVAEDLAQMHPEQGVRLFGDLDQ